MDILIFTQCLLLLLVANGAPVLAWRLFGDRFSTPLDSGTLFPMDKRPWLGQSKTVRGILASILATPVLAYLLGLPPLMGLEVAAFAMLGDLLSSFTKRRLKLPSSAKALGLDQIPESLLPMLAVKTELQLGWPLIGLIVAAFAVLELLLSRLLFRLHLRKRPH